MTSLARDVCLNDHPDILTTRSPEGDFVRRTSADNCDDVNRITPLLIAGQRNEPFWPRKFDLCALLQYCRHAGVAQWQSRWLPTRRRGFDSLCPHQFTIRTRCQ